MEDLSEELTELNVLTLNCWGLLHLSAQRAARLQVIGHTIGSTTPTPHIVALQECWTQEDYLAIRRATRFILPYGKFYHSGAFGGGLAILSKWPIEESSMHQYPLNGRPTAFFRGDWFVGKGVACAKIRYGTGPRDVVEVFNTHVSRPEDTCIFRNTHDPRPSDSPQLRTWNQVYIYRTSTVSSLGTVQAVARSCRSWPSGLGTRRFQRHAHVPHASHHHCSLYRKGRLEGSASRFIRGIG